MCAPELAIDRLWSYGRQMSTDGVDSPKYNTIALAAESFSPLAFGWMLGGDNIRWSEAVDKFHSARSVASHHSSLALCTVTFNPIKDIAHKVIESITLVCIAHKLSSKFQQFIQVLLFVAGKGPEARYLGATFFRVSYFFPIIPIELNRIFCFFAEVV